MDIERDPVRGQGDGHDLRGDPSVLVRVHARLFRLTPLVETPDPRRGNGSGIMDEIEDRDTDALLDLRDMLQSILDGRRDELARQLQAINERLRSKPSPWRPDPTR